MKKLYRKVKNKAKKALNEAKAFKPANYSRARYFWYRDHCPIAEKTILIESAGGNRPTDNVEAILFELAKNPRYKEYDIYLAGGKSVDGERKNYLKQNGLKKRVTTLVINSVQYYKVLATAKYLVTDDAFIYIFTKRAGQIYLNLWHGTPLMTLGKNKKTDFAMIGNEQKNFFDADYLLCQNEYAMNHMIEDYMLENFAKTKIWLSGYPRNEILKNSERREAIRSELSINAKQVIAYLPTWRKNVKGHSKSEHTEQMLKNLAQWDSMLSTHQVVYVKQHTVNRVEIDFTKYQNIRPFPEFYGTYEFLSAVDMLVTDYSSVMFDFALTGRKIVLFTYDREWYEETRGLHLSLEELPFPKADNVKKLAEELQYPKKYEDRDFLKRFCSYDKEKVTEAICHKLLFGEESPLVKEREIPYNGKKNVVLYIGGFEKNGLTTAGANLLHNLDRTKNNYAVIYCMTSVQKRQESIKVIPEDISLMTFYYFRSLTFSELVPYVI